MNGSSVPCFAVNIESSTTIFKAEMVLSRQSAEKVEFLFLLFLKFNFVRGRDYLKS